MEERLARLEAQLESVRKEMKETIVATEQNILREMSNMMQSFLMQISKGKSTTDMATPDSGKYFPISSCKDSPFSGSQPIHMQERIPVQVGHSVLIHPPMQPDKVISIFPNASEEASHDHLTNNLSGSINLVMTEELVETISRNRRICGMDASRKESKKKDHDAKIPRSQASRGKDQSFQKKKERKGKGNQSFAPLPLTYKDLYAQLYRDNLVRPYAATPWNPPFPNWFDPNAHCEYHSGVPGHSIEDCVTFKNLVQGLIKQGILQIGKTNITVNPLPNLEDQGINLVETGSDGGDKNKAQILVEKGQLKF